MFNVEIKSAEDVEKYQNRLQSFVTTVETLENPVACLNETYEIFNQAKALSFEVVDGLLKYCADFGVCYQKTYDINADWEFECIVKMLNFYLIKNSNSIDLIQSLAHIRDTYVEKEREKTSGQSSLWTVSHLLDPDSDRVKSDSKEDMTIMSSFKGSGSQRPERAFSFEQLVELFRQFEEKKQHTKKYLKTESNALIQGVVAYCYRLKKDNPLKKIAQDEDIQNIIRGFRFGIAVHGSVIDHLKLQPTVDVFTLDRVFRTNAFLSRTFADYYEHTSESQTSKAAARMNARRAQESALNLKGILVCEHILNSSETSSDEKKRAQKLKEKQLNGYYLHEPIDHLEVAWINQSWSMMYYTSLSETFNQFKNSVPRVSFYPLYCYATYYLEQTLVHFIGVNVSIFHVEDATVEDEIVIRDSLLSQDKTETRAQLLSILSLYYEIKASYIKEMQAVPEHDEQMVFLKAKAFEDEFRLNVYHYLLNPPDTDDVEKRSQEYQLILKQTQYGSSLIRSLALYEQCCLDDALKSETTEQEIDEPIDQASLAVKKDSQSTPDFYRLKKEQKEQKKQSQQQFKQEQQIALETLEKIHRKSLPFSPAWNAVRKQLFEALQANNDSLVLSLLEQSLTSTKTLSKAEQYDAYLLKGVCLKDKGLYSEATIAFHQAWDKLAAEDDICLYYTQKEKLMLEIAQLLEFKGQSPLAKMMIDELTQWAKTLKTVCFPLLLKALLNGPEEALMIAIDQYSQLIDQLKNQEAVFYINEYNLYSFLMFYQLLSRGHFDKAVYLYNSNGVLSPEPYFEESVTILTVLVQYAKVYAAPNLFDLQLALILRYKEIYDVCPENKTYLNNAERLFQRIDEEYKDVSAAHRQCLQEVRDALEIKVNPIVREKEKIYARHFERSQNIYQQLKQTYPAECQETASELKDKIETIFQRQTCLDQIKSIMKLLCYKIYEYHHSSSQNEYHRAFFTRLDVMDSEMIAEVSLHQEALRARVKSDRLERGSAEAIEQLIALYHVEMAYFSRLCYIQKEQEKAREAVFETSRMGDVSTSIPIQLKFLLALKKELHTFKLVTQAECLAFQHAKSMTVDIQGVSEEDKQWLWLPFKKALKNIKEVKTPRLEDYVCAAQITDWFLMQMVNQSSGLVQTEEQRIGLEHIFSESKRLCKSYYQKAIDKNSIINESLKQLKADVAKRELPPFELVKTCEPMSALTR